VTAESHGPEATEHPMTARPHGPDHGYLPRPIDGVYTAPPRHWVGDGFHVAGYFNRIPNAAHKLDPFLLLDYHPPEVYPPTTGRRGVGVHPHRGFETVTIAWQGGVAHHDSAGHGGVIGPGDVQWMTAASGILHKEYHAEDFAREGGTFHMAQIWVNLPRAHKLDPPRYQGILAADIPVVSLPGEGGEVRVIAGEHDGVSGAAQTFTPVTLLDVRLAAGGDVVLRQPPSHTLALLVMDGAPVLDRDRFLRVGDLVTFERAAGDVLLSASAPAHLLVLGGEPLREPIVQYGPFVMSTREEIAQAFSDFHGGRFGHLAD